MITLEVIAPIVSVAGVLLAAISSFKLATSRKASGVAVQRAVNVVVEQTQQHAKQLAAIDDELNTIIAEHRRASDVKLEHLVPRFRALSEDQKQVIAMLGELKAKTDDDQSDDLDKVLVEMRGVQGRIETILQKAQSQVDAA